MMALSGGRGADRATCPLSAALPFLAHRMWSHRAVIGLLYRLEEGHIDLHVVAAAPMVAALRVLTRRWVGLAREFTPSLRWSVHVGPDLPEDDAAYQCIFWRRR